MYAQTYNQIYTTSPHTHIFTHIHTQTHTHKYTRTSTNKHTHTRTHTHTQINTQIRTQTEHTFLLCVLIFSLLSLSSKVHDLGLVYVVLTPLPLHFFPFLRYSDVVFQSTLRSQQPKFISRSKNRPQQQALWFLLPALNRLLQNRPSVGRYRCARPKQV